LCVNPQTETFCEHTGFCQWLDAADMLSTTTIIIPFSLSSHKGPFTDNVSFKRTRESSTHTRS